MEEYIMKCSSVTIQSTACVMGDASLLW